MLVNKINEIVNKIVNKIAKNLIKIARKRRSVIDTKLLHQRLEHSEIDRIIYLQNAVEDIEISEIDELSKKVCRICIKIKKTKLQQHITAIRFKELLKHVYMNY